MRRVMLLACAAACTTGCVSTQRHPLARPPIQLADERAFVVHLTDSATAGETCAVRHLRAEVRGVHGDTILLDHAVTMRRATRSPECLGGRAGFVVLSEHPTVESVTIRPHPWRSLGAVLVAIPFGVALTLVAILGAPI